MHSRCAYIIILLYSELVELIRRVSEVESGSQWRELEEQTEEHVSALGGELLAPTT